MHILPGALILALLFAAPAHSAGDPRIKTLAGVWRGTVTTSPDGCAWDVKANVTEKLGYATGNFTYSGPCSRGLKIGTFNASPAGQGCFSLNVNVPGMPKMQLSACFDSQGNLSFGSMLLNGTLRFAEESTKAGLEAKSPLGSAAGEFAKAKAPAAAVGKKGRKNAQSLKARPLEVHGRSD